MVHWHYSTYVSFHFHHHGLLLQDFLCFILFHRYDSVMGCFFFRTDISLQKMNSEELGFWERMFRVKRRFYFLFFFCWLFYFIFFNFIFKLYITVLVLPNIKMNQPQVYMCSPSWTLLPPPSPYHPSGSLYTCSVFFDMGHWLLLK